MSCKIVGNWKMNCGAPSEAAALVKSLKELLPASDLVEVGICPPFTALASVAEDLLGSRIKVGAQNLHWEKSGAFTGEISASFLKNIGVNFTLVGHSERRHLFGESSEEVRKRLLGGVQAGLEVILCIGEELRDRESESTERVLEEQMYAALKDLSSTEAALVTVAYEPVWAIGTGRVATRDQIDHAHSFIKNLWRGIFPERPLSVLYGGSVNPKNFPDIIESAFVDGALVGGVSLKADQFAELVKIGLKAFL